MDSKNERLRHARETAGYETLEDAVERLGVKYYTYAQHENGIRGFPAKKAELYARVFRVNVEWLLFGRGPMRGAHKSDPHTEQGKGSANSIVGMLNKMGNVNSALQLPQISHNVPVYGYVEAGAWREMSEIEEIIEIVPFHAPEYGRIALSGWVVSGPSANKFYPHGSVVIGASPHDVPLRKGSFVVVKRMRSGTAEVTLKQFEVTADGQWQFWPRSTDSKYQTPFTPPPRDENAQEGWEIQAIIIGESKKVPQTGDIIEFDQMPTKTAG